MRLTTRLVQHGIAARYAGVWNNARYTMITRMWLSWFSLDGFVAGSVWNVCFTVRSPGKTGFKLQEMLATCVRDECVHELTT